MSVSGAEAASVADARLLVAMVAIAGSIFVWVVQQIVLSMLRAGEKKRGSENFVRSLSAEIDFNTRDMEIFLTKSVSSERLRQALREDPDLVPHITDARHTEVYRARISELHNISDHILQKTINFYGLLEKIRVQVEGVDSPSFKTISAEGRFNVVDLIRSTAEEARREGVDLLREFRKAFPELDLRRYDRETLSPEAEPELDANRIKAELQQLAKRAGTD